MKTETVYIGKLETEVQQSISLLVQFFEQLFIIHFVLTVQREGIVI